MEKDKKNNKLIIVLIVVIVLLLCAILLKCFSKTNNKYIVLDDYIIEYNSNTMNKANYDEVKGYNFRLLYSNEYIGNYSFDHVDEKLDRLYFKNSDGVNIINTPLLGLDSNTEIIDYRVEDMTKEDFNLYKSLLSTDINYKLSDLTTSKKYIINNKDKEIKVYIVKYEGEEEKDDYSMIFVSSDNKTVMLDEDYPKEERGGYEFYSFNVEYVIDLNRDNKYELIVSKSHHDVTGYSIYSLDDSFQELYYTGA